MHFSVEQKPSPQSHNTKESLDFHAGEATFDYVDSLPVESVTTETFLPKPHEDEVFLLPADRPTLRKQGPEAIGTQMKTKLDLSYATAVHGAEWIERLKSESNSPIRRIGTRALNTLGILSPTQKSIEGHQANIDLYFDEIGLQELSNEAHLAKRDEVVRLAFADKFKDYLKQSFTEHDDSEAEPEETAKQFLVWFCGYDGKESPIEFIDSLDDETLVSVYDRYEKSEEAAYEQKNLNSLDELRTTIENRQRAESGLPPLDDSEVLPTENESIKEKNGLTEKVQSDIIEKERRSLVNEKNTALSLYDIRRDIESTLLASSGRAKEVEHNQQVWEGLKRLEVNYFDDWENKHLSEFSAMLNLPGEPDKVARAAALKSQESQLRYFKDMSARLKAQVESTK